MVSQLSNAEIEQVCGGGKEGDQRYRDVRSGVLFGISATNLTRTFVHLAKKNWGAIPMTLFSSVVLGYAGYRSLISKQDTKKLNFIENWFRR